MTAQRRAPRTELAAACDVVVDDPRVRMAIVVLPRRLRYRDLGPFTMVRQEHEARLHRRTDGGLDLVVLDAAVARSGAQEERPARHAPAWISQLMHMTEGVR